MANDGDDETRSSKATIIVEKSRRVSCGEIVPLIALQRFGDQCHVAPSNDYT